MMSSSYFTLCQTYKLDLETFYDVLEARPTEDKLTMCALISAQKCLLCLGDLARYKETIQETCNYGVARQHYQKASNVLDLEGEMTEPSFIMIDHWIIFVAITTTKMISK